MIKAILFDMDGTLVDSERYYTEMSYKWVLQYSSIEKEISIKSLVPIWIRHIELCLSWLACHMMKQRRVMMSTLVSIQ